MESNEYLKKVKYAIFHLYYYLFYNYNINKIKSFIFALIDIFQLFSMNINERVKNIF